MGDYTCHIVWYMEMFQKFWKSENTVTCSRIWHDLASRFLDCTVHCLGKKQKKIQHVPYIYIITVPCPFCFTWCHMYPFVRFGIHICAFSIMPTCIVFVEGFAICCRSSIAWFIYLSLSSWISKLNLNYVTFCSWMTFSYRELMLNWLCTRYTW